MKVELISYTPHPDAVCNVAAGTCVSEDIPVMEMSVNRFRALKGALASGHESVAEHASFTFAIEGVSRALTHQLVRHRLASFSQQSQRYVKVTGENNELGLNYITPYSIWDIGMDYEYDELMDSIESFYDKMIAHGIPEEDARYILPNACCTNIVVTMNARELRHFFALRCCTRAQWEIRELADKMLELCKEVAPTLFNNAGASCVATGKCPEGKKSCGRVKE